MPWTSLAAQVRDDGLAGDRHLVDPDENLGRERHVDVDAGSEADQPEALAGDELVPRLDEAQDAARVQPRDLHDPDAHARALDHERVALVVLARLVELGVDEKARRIDLRDDTAGDRRP